MVHIIITLPIPLGLKKLHYINSAEKEIDKTHVSRATAPLGVLIMFLFTNYKLVHYTCVQLVGKSGTFRRGQDRNILESPKDVDVQIYVCTTTNVK